MACTPGKSLTACQRNGSTALPPCGGSQPVLQLVNPKRVGYRHAKGGIKFNKWVLEFRAAGRTAAGKPVQKKVKLEGGESLEEITGNPLFHGLYFIRFNHLVDTVSWELHGEWNGKAIAWPVQTGKDEVITAHNLEQFRMRMEYECLRADLECGLPTDPVRLMRYPDLVAKFGL